ncbi:hypothetical protein acsn021_27130 [Anaerocolumna cellulosilytica]|uniref:Uncharacterized protein n=1 Tax=Anaerocolumna cellulosilytica TaxID=433286 RepID=A0A6S6QWZ4_9FIRM|nr:hypothetical protein acsn021_27130 [Anaerocolumna cellulosilytica]
MLVIHSNKGVKSELLFLSTKYDNFIKIAVKGRSVLHIPLLCINFNSRILKFSGIEKWHSCLRACSS